MELIKTVENLLKDAKTKVLSIGTPPQKEVLYKEVVKRKVPNQSAEKMFIEEIKHSVKNIFSSDDDDIEFARGTANPPVKKALNKKDATKKKAPVKKMATNKKTTTTKKDVAKTRTTKKKPLSKKITTTTTKSSKKDEKIALYIKDIKKHYGEVDEDFVAIIVKNLGPSIYRKNAELVSCSNPKELDTVRRNFLIKKLAIDASKVALDTAIQEVCEELKGVRNKYRATFYYRLAKKFNKESVLQ